MEKLVQSIVIALAIGFAYGQTEDSVAGAEPTLGSAVTTMEDTTTVSDQDGAVTGDDLVISTASSGSTSTTTLKNGRETEPTGDGSTTAGSVKTTEEPGNKEPTERGETTEREISKETKDATTNTMSETMETEDSTPDNEAVTTDDETADQTMTTLETDGTMNMDDVTTTDSDGITSSQTTQTSVGNTTPQTGEMMGRGLRFTEIRIRGRRVRFEWMAAPELKGPQIEYEIECEADLINHRIDEETETEMSLLLDGFRPDQQYVCTLTATDETTDRQLSKIRIVLITPSISPISPVAAIAMFTMGVALLVITVLVLVVVGIVVYKRRKRGESFSPAQYEFHKNQRAHPGYTLQRPVPQPPVPVIYNTLGPMYEPIPDPTYEHLPPTPTEVVGRQVEPTQVEGNVEPNYHVLDHEVTRKSHDSNMQENKGEVGTEGTEDHTYYVLEQNSPKNNNTNQEHEQEIEALGGLKSDPQQQEDQNPGDPQDYEMPTTSLHKTA